MYKIRTNRAFLSFVILAFVVGDCVQLTKGVFRGSYWRITGINKGGTFDLSDGQDVLREVRGSFIAEVEDRRCK